MNENAFVETLEKEMETRTGNPFYSREITEIVLLSKILGDCKSFVDVGASLGPYTWSANLMLNNATIISVEANPRLCSHLEEQWSDIETKKTGNGNNHRVINAALSDKPGRLAFFINKESYLNSYIGDVINGQKSDESHERIELEALSLDHIFPGDPPEFVKIDIEGAEWRALKGASEIIRKRKTRFLVEIHPWGDSSLNKRPSDVFALMSDADYSVQRLSQHWLFTPIKPSYTDKVMAGFYGFVLNHPSLRKLAKSILLRH